MSEERAVFIQKLAKQRHRQGANVTDGGPFFRLGLKSKSTLLDDGYRAYRENCPTVEQDEKELFRSYVNRFRSGAPIVPHGAFHNENSSRPMVKCDYKES